MVNLVLTAQNFAFGSIGKLLYFTEGLKNKGYRLIFVGYGTSYDLAKRYHFDEIYELDTEDPKNTLELEKIISKGDALISTMDLPSLTIAKKLKKVTIWVDCLFWFWDEIQSELFDVDLFIREKSLDDSINEKRFAPKIKNLQTVGPIIGKINKKERKKQALISYGGGQATHFYKVGKQTNYPFMMTEILRDYVDWSTFEKVILATSDSVVRRLKKRYSNEIFEFTTLAHDRFLEVVAESEILLTAPGLITAQVAYYYETPTIFLLPSNDSQYLQLEAFRRLSLDCASTALSDFMPKLDILHMHTSESTTIVLKQLAKLEKEKFIRKEVGNKLNLFMKNRNKWSKKAVKQGKDFINSCGGNGADSVVDLIDKLLISRGIVK